MQIPRYARNDSRWGFACGMTSCGGKPSPRNVLETQMTLARQINSVDAVAVFLGFRSPLVTCSVTAAAAMPAGNRIRHFPAGGGLSRGESQFPARRSD